MIAGLRSYRLLPGAETGFYEKLEQMKSDGKLVQIKTIEFMRGMTGKNLDESI